MWSSLELFTLSQALGVHTKVEKAKDAEWIHGVLAFLKTSVECPDIGTVMDKNDQTEHIHYLVRMLKIVSPKMEVGTYLAFAPAYIHRVYLDIVHADHPAFTARVAGPIKLAETKDGLYLDVVVHNRLPCVWFSATSNFLTFKNMTCRAGQLMKLPSWRLEGTLNLFSSLPRLRKFLLENQR